MENRSILRIAWIYLALLCATLTTEVLAYDDGLDKYAETSTHQTINRLAIQLFERTYLNNQGPDLNLRNATFTGRNIFGIDWHSVIDGPRNLPPRVTEKREKSLRNWIINGGFSADQPEWTMALVHFYDPSNQTTPYLNDQQWVVNFIRRLGGTTFANPEIDAVTWTFHTQLNDTSQHIDLFDQEYGWQHAKEYLKKAIEHKDSRNDNYGRAWRALGEVMHMIADMTVPAHVRNDGHAAAVRDPDPYEHCTYARDIEANWDNGDHASLIYFRFDAEQVMRDVAKYTNENFLSKDTIPGNATLVGNHAVPALTSMAPDLTFKGYLEFTTTDGKTYTAAAPNTWWNRWYHTNPYAIDRVVVRAQQRILIPTAVRAAAGMIYAFLPRFTIDAEVKKSDSKGKYNVVGKANLIENIHCDKDINIWNGAFVVVERNNTVNKRIAVEASVYPLNSFTREVEAVSGDTIRIEYDFGGYVVSSAPHKVEEEEAEPVPFAFSNIWSEVHFPGSFNPALATIEYIAIFDGQVIGAQNPVITIEDFYNTDDAKNVEIRNMKTSEAVTVTGNFEMSLSTSTVSPTSPASQYIYTYSNPRLVRYIGANPVETYPGMSFSYEVPSGDAHEEIDIYIVYDVEIKIYKRDTENDPFVLTGTENWLSKIFNLFIRVYKDLPEYATP